MPCNKGGEQMIASDSVGRESSVPLRSPSAFPDPWPTGHHSLTHLTVEHKAHCNKPARRMAVSWLRFPLSLNTFFLLLPPPTVAHSVTPACVALFLLWLWTSLSFVWWHSPFHSEHPELWDSPKPCPEEVDWSFRDHACGSCGSVASAKQVYSSCMESSKNVAVSPSTQWSVLFSQAVGRRARKALSLWGDGRGSLRKGLTNVWYVCWP